MGTSCKEIVCSSLIVVSDYSKKSLVCLKIWNPRIEWNLLSCIDPLVDGIHSHLFTQNRIKQFEDIRMMTAQGSLKDSMKAFDAVIGPRKIAFCNSLTVPHLDRVKRISARSANPSIFKILKEVLMNVIVSKVRQKIVGKSIVSRLHVSQSSS